MKQAATKYIRVDPEVYQALAERVSGFESPNDVLRRILQLNGTPKLKAKSATG